MIVLIHGPHTRHTARIELPCVPQKLDFLVDTHGSFVELTLIEAPRQACIPADGFGYMHHARSAAEPQDSVLCIILPIFRLLIVTGLMSVPREADAVSGIGTGFPADLHEL